MAGQSFDRMATPFAYLYTVGFQCRSQTFPTYPKKAGVILDVAIDEFSDFNSVSVFRSEVSELRLYDHS